MVRLTKQVWLLGAGFSLLLACLPSLACAQIANVISSSFGAANRGAATAMPLDATNSQYWNSASITELETTELDLNVQPYFPDVSVSSSLDANALAPGRPPLDLSGHTTSTTKFGGVVGLGFVKKFERSRFTTGLLLTGIIGPGERFKQSANNAILTAPNPRGVGVGQIQENGSVIFIAPTLAYKVNQHWSLGVQPSLEIASLLADPLSRVPPDDANEDGIPTYPRPDHAAWSTGIGVQGSIYGRFKDWHVGTSLRSPSWYIPYRFKSKDENGNTRYDKVHNNLPMILSMGLGYSGIPRLKLAMDTRYINYSNTAGFDKSGYTSEQAVRGRGWRNIWAWVMSSQYQVTKRLALRGVYAYNEMPIRPNLTQFSLTSPTVIKHQMSVGFVYHISQHVTLAASYQHGFSNSSQGPFLTPARSIPDSTVKLKGGLNTMAVSFIFK